MKKLAIAMLLAGATSLMAADGATIFKACAVCHGAKADTVYAGKVPALTSLSSAEIVTALNEYKAGTRNKFAMGAVMSAQAKLHIKTDDDAKAVADYIATLK